MLKPPGALSSISAMIPLTTIAPMTIANAPQNGKLVQWLIAQAINAATDNPMADNSGENVRFLNFIFKVRGKDA